MVYIIVIKSRFFLHPFNYLKGTITFLKPFAPVSILLTILDFRTIA